MKEYVFRLLATVAGIGVLHFLVLFNVRAPINAEYFIRTFVIVKSDILSKLPSPRIILAGGSSTLFGIDAIQVERAMGFPCANEGVSAGQRLDDLLEPVRKQARSGDIVLLALEGSLYMQDGSWDEEQLKNALAWNPNEVDGKSVAERFRIFSEAAGPELDFSLLRAQFEQRFHPSAIARRVAALAPVPQIAADFYAHLGQSPAFEYEPTNLDARGDILHTDTGEIYWGKAGSASEPDGIGPAAAGTLSRFLAEMKSRQVRVFFIHTPYLIDGAPDENWKAAETSFSDALARISGRLIDRREELFFARKYFFNTRFHLNAEGRAIRTQRLIEDLRAALAGPGSAR
jgi:hypothetical protein